MADKCPWLENKIIDFNFFLNQNIISKNEYNRLKKVLHRHRNNGTVYIVEELENVNYLLDMASKDNELIKQSERCYLLK